MNRRKGDFYGHIEAAYDGPIQAETALQEEKAGGRDKLSELRMVFFSVISRKSFGFLGRREKNGRQAGRLYELQRAVVVYQQRRNSVRRDQACHNKARIFKSQSLKVDMVFNLRTYLPTDKKNKRAAAPARFNLKCPDASRSGRCLFIIYAFANFFKVCYH